MTLAFLGIVEGDKYLGVSLGSSVKFGDLKMHITNFNFGVLNS